MEESKFNYAEDVAFFSRAKDVCHAPNQNYAFDCPLCGGKADASRKNGVMRAKCSGCGMSC